MKVRTESDFEERLKDGNDRPLFDFEAPAMKTLAQNDWDMPLTLFQIVSECKIRSQKNKRSRATGLLKFVEPRLEELLAMKFPTEPDPVLGKGDFGDF